MNLISYANLKDNTNFQSIYSSQLYGTFFSVFAKFIATKNKKNYEYTFDKIELKLVNYKGNLDLKIVKASLSEIISEGKLSDYKLDLEVKAGSCNTESILADNVEGRIFLTNKHTIKIERFLKPMHQINDETDFPARKDGKFDTEFFYREGLFDRDDALKTGKFKPTQLGEISNTGTTSGSQLCPYAWVWFDKLEL